MITAHSYWQCNMMKSVNRSLRTDCLYSCQRDFYHIPLYRTLNLFSNYDIMNLYLVETWIKHLTCCCTNVIFTLQTSNHRLTISKVSKYRISVYRNTRLEHSGAADNNGLHSPQWIIKYLFSLKTCCHQVYMHSHFEVNRCQCFSFICFLTLVLCEHITIYLSQV